jgi:thioredoxin-related protein
MTKQTITFILFCAFAYATCAQEENGLVKWLTLQEAQEKNKEVKKPFIIDIYTDWCGWCKHMMKTTYSNPGIAAYINTNFYPVKFNAETKDTIEYNGKVYKPLSPQPRTAHELAIKFLGSGLSYPSTLFVTNNFEYNLLSQGFLEDKKLEPFLVFMVENAWQVTPFGDFEKHFNNTFYDTVFPKLAVKTISIQELEALQKKKPRKVLVNIGADFCNTCKIMTKTTFPDTAVAAYINKNFYFVNFDAASKDTIVFRNEKFFNTLINNYPLNTLSLKLSNNRFTIPVLCILDEQLNTIDALNFYQPPERLKPILAFIASNAYKDKTKTFNDFMQNYMKPATAKRGKK